MWKRIEWGWYVYHVHSILRERFITLSQQHVDVVVLLLWYCQAKPIACQCKVSQLVGLYFTSTWVAFLLSSFWQDITVECKKLVLILPHLAWVSTDPFWSRKTGSPRCVGWSVFSAIPRPSCNRIQVKFGASDSHRPCHGGESCFSSHLNEQIRNIMKGKTLNLYKSRKAKSSHHLV